MSYPLPRDPGDEETCSQCGRTHDEVWDMIQARALNRRTWWQHTKDAFRWRFLRRARLIAEEQDWIYLQLRRSAGPRLQGNYAVDVPLCSPLCRAMFERVREKLDAAEVTMQELHMKAADPGLARQLAKWDVEGDPTVEDHPHYSAEEWDKLQAEKWEQRAQEADRIRCVLD